MHAVNEILAKQIQNMVDNQSIKNQIFNQLLIILWNTWII